MLGKNITYYRLKKNFTKKQLAEMLGITPMSVTYYEQDKRTPDLAMTRKIAAALDTDLASLIANRSGAHQYQHCEYRKNSKLSKNRQDYICASVEDYFNRFLTVSEILGKGALRDAPHCHSIQPTMDVEMT